MSMSRRVTRSLKIPALVVLAMRRDRARGLSFRDITQRYGYGLRTCHRAIRGVGGYRLTTRYSKLPQVCPETARAMRRSFKDLPSYTLVGKQFGVSRQLAHKVIRGVGCYGGAVYR